MAEGRKRGRPKVFEEDRAQVCVRVPLSLHRRLTEVSEARDVSINRLMVKAAEVYLDALPPLEPFTREEQRDGQAIAQR